jgi:hypothetical protein
MSFKKAASILILLIVSGLHAIAQRDSVGLATIVTKTDKLAAEHPFEKVYLHFDKPYYAVGDTIWFKAYLTIGPKHQISGLSNVVYIDVINSQDSLIKTLKLPVITGIAFGDITLSKYSFKQGNYRIRAYTNWMRNFDADYFFNKSITIGNPDNNNVPPQISIAKTTKNNEQVINARLLFKDGEGNLYAGKKVSWTVKNGEEAISKGKGSTDKNGYLAVTFTSDKLKSADKPALVTVIEAGNRKVITNSLSLKAALATADVQFFPEGGDLIVGVRSKVAFKAVSADGLGVEVTGKVVDNAGAEIADITTAHAGMGIFALLPEAGKSYKAIIKFPDGTTGNFDLPVVRAGGINLAVNNNDPDNLSIKIATNAAYLQQYQNKGFYIVAQSGGTIYYAGRAALQSQVYTAVVPKSKFPTGVLQLTLFEATGEPISERVAFIQHNDTLNIALGGSLPTYNVRENVKMTITAKNAAAPVEGSFSVAVIDESKVPFNDDAETTILSSLLLTSDLRGYVEKPNYYFNHADSKKLANLDILMLTQGYRRFSYTDLLADKYPPLTYSPEQGINISGTLRTTTGVPIDRGNINMLIADRNISKNIVTDVEGHFKFENLPLMDSSQVVLSARNNPNNTSLMIMADAIPKPPVAKNYENPGQITNIDSTLSVYLQNSRKQGANSHVLKEVVIKGTRTAKVTHEPYPSLKGLSMETDQTLTADLLKDCGNDFEGCVLSKVFGIWHVDNKYYVKRDYDAGNKKPIKFFVNGLGIDDGYINNINPADIESIEVYLKDGVAGLMRFYDCNGIISITTKTHSFDTAVKPNTDLSLLGSASQVTLNPKGFYKTRIFYSPKYNNPQNMPAQGTDLRTTIYWNPNILTDKNGNATFDYYNADGRGTYKAIVEGIDNDGNIGRYILRYKVK